MGPSVRSRGITLIELLVAMVIAAVLATIAIPSYRSHVIRTQRTDAIGALLQVQAAQEKYFLQYNRYTSQLTAAPPAGLGLRDTSEHGYYTLEIQVPAGAPEADAYRVIARPRAGTGPAGDARCQLFSIDQNGRKYAQDAEGNDRTAECWRR